jgi:transposase-like protein
MWVQVKEDETQYITEEYQECACELYELTKLVRASRHRQGIPLKYRWLSLPIVAAGRRNVQSDEDEIFAEYSQHRYLNNRAENSHQPTRQRERHMQRFKSAEHAQRFLAAYGPIASHFRPRRHRLSASAYRQQMRQQFRTWREITSLAMAA